MNQTLSVSILQFSLFHIVSIAVQTKAVLCENGKDFSMWLQKQVDFWGYYSAM